MSGTPRRRGRTAVLLAPAAPGVPPPAAFFLRQRRWHGDAMLPRGQDVRRRCGGWRSPCRLPFAGEVAAASSSLPGSPVCRGFSCIGRVSPCAVSVADLRVR
uniref:Uncharacterized protein n=1 Tax=Oryza nivara TaxID=4536 RepID=A0A0E0FJ73_ORYNI